MVCLCNSNLISSILSFNIRIHVYFKIFRVVCLLFQDNHLFPQSWHVFFYLCSYVSLVGENRGIRENFPVERAPFIPRLNCDDFFLLWSAIYPPRRSLNEWATIPLFFYNDTWNYFIPYNDRFLSLVNNKKWGGGGNSSLRNWKIKVEW